MLAGAGIGSDGMRGAEAIAAVGGSVIAQDEASSVIWGMPAQALAAWHAETPIPDEVRRRATAELDDADLQDPSAV